MTVPIWAGFVADFADDQVEVGEEITVFGGRNVALALCEIFADLGGSKVSDPKASGEEGWYFKFQHQGHHFWCRIQSFHPVFWLLFEGPSDSRGGLSAHAELWRKFGNALERDPRFHKILWRSAQEGPPDWDEVEATIEPPEQSFIESFTWVESGPPDLKPGCLSVLFGCLFMFFGAGWTISYLFFYMTPDRWEEIQTNLGFFLVGLAIFFWARIRWWIDGLRYRFAVRPRA